MRLEDCYRTLDLNRHATDAEVKRAWRSLTKVWHPDRFAHDPDLQRTAEEKVKEINEAYETIRQSRLGAWSDDEDYDSTDSPGPWRVRIDGREYGFASLEEIAALTSRGAIREPAEVFDPGSEVWKPLAEIPALHAALQQRLARRLRSWMYGCVAAALFILVRRPTPGGVIVALVLFGVAGFLLFRMRSNQPREQ
ncbi:MAG TPA: DnaJ domain-containing protein [Thermoanaerobaculia bacterium]